MTAIPALRWAPGHLDTDALRDIAPAIVGVAPFGVLVGVTLAELRIGLADGVAGSFAIFSGSAQMTVLALLAGGAGPLAILLTLALTNARLLVYGAALAPAFRHQPAWFRWLAPHVIVDQLYAMAVSRDMVASPDRFRRYWLTAGGVLTMAWLGSVGLGMLLGPVLPEGSPLEVAMPAFFIGLVVPKLRDPAARPTAAVAGLVSAVCIGLPRGSGLIVAIIAGGLVAALVSRPGRNSAAAAEVES